MGTPPSIAATLVRELYESSGAATWDVSLDAFAARLTTAAEARFRDERPSPDDVDGFLRSLHLSDVALACGCLAGKDAAWEHFVREMRPTLYAAARTITHSDEARDLADSLYAQLLGVDARGEQRRSLLDYYHGRARLTTWLRTVLVQRHIDRVRQVAKQVSLDTPGIPEPVAAAMPDDPRARERVAHVQRALNDAIHALDPRERLRLRLYYGQGLKLAAIGRMFGEHEATASRKLERIRTQLRQDVERRLREQHGPRIDPATWMQEAGETGELDLSHALTADDS